MWLNLFEEVMKTMGVGNWRQESQHQDQWQEIVKEAVVHHRLWRPQKKLYIHYSTERVKKTIKISTNLQVFSPPGIAKRGFWNAGHVYVYMDLSLAPE
jgi:hypothetical protein